MPISEARKRANQKYIDKLGEIKIRVSKEQKEKVQAYAADRGESVNGFIVRAVDEAMRREGLFSFNEDKSTTIIKKEDQINRIPLSNTKKIYLFSLLWGQLYKIHGSVPGYFFEDILFIGEGLADLGFEMDCGKSYYEAFSETMLPDIDKLQQQLPKMNIEILGNLIFSQWRYWNHWSNAPMNEKDYQWFVLAFTRLAELASVEN